MLCLFCPLFDLIWNELFLFGNYFYYKLLLLFSIYSLISLIICHCACCTGLPLFILHNVGCWDQGHGIGPCHYRLFYLYGNCDACCVGEKIFRLRDPHGLAVLCVWIRYCGQHRSLLASWHQPANKEEHTELQGRDGIHILQWMNIINVL